MTPWGGVSKRRLTDGSAWLRLWRPYIAAAVACTWPLAMEMSSTLGAPVGPGDPFLDLWILGWGMQAA